MNRRDWLNPEWLQAVRQWVLARLGVYPCLNGPHKDEWRRVAPENYRLVYPYGSTSKTWPAWLHKS